MTESQVPKRRALRPGELLAISPDVIQEDRGAFFWLFGPPVPRNERIGQVSVVRVNGPLEYHDDGCGDSYEWLFSRVDKAMSGQDIADAHEREHRWDDDYEPMTAAPPKCVVMRLDSPGGVVAGLEQTVNRLRKMADERGIPLYAYVDEMAYSAAYALCCACSRVVLPRSGFCGSIGVISTMVDQSKKDAKDGYRFVVLTSGERKADGHPHVPISDAMIDEERPRVMTLAKHFFSMVKRARGITIKDVDSFQAKRFLGKEAVEAKVADTIQSWDAFVKSLNEEVTTTDTRVSVNGNQPKEPVANSVKSGHTASSTETKPMDALAKLNARIAVVEASLKTEKDPAKLAALAADLDAYKKTKHMIEKHETEEGDEEDEEEEEEEAAGDETDRSDEEDEDEDEDEDDEEKSKAIVANLVQSAGIVDKDKRKAFRSVVEETVRNLLASSPAAKVMAEAQKITGKKSAASVVAALRGQEAGIEDLKKRVASIETGTRDARKANLIDAAKNAHRITPAEAKKLRSEPVAFVEKFLSMRPKAIVNTDGNDNPVPDLSGSALPKDLQAVIAAAQAVVPGLKVEDVAKDMANGAGKRV